MGSEYDCKFEEMKKYIPFLESMIKRLESNTSSSLNPRQAQLDKIRSLRDLLLDKKKRMKMDNLLKCEQVLVNLYAKVEQKDTLPVVKVETMDSSKECSDLEAVRNKLKTVVKMQNITETLPEIARASEIEEICEPGSKEPALFQRRPNMPSLSPTKRSPRKAHETKIQSRRSYTRVLVSPEHRSSRWHGNEETSTDIPLFSRRSPRRSPRRNSPTYHKKERKKISKSKEGKSRKDLNITLKVPEESLHSLNTEDILSRIINCSDGDVDIDTLRELRSQILGELKQTGTNDDISELILKSYNKKSKPRKKKKPEVEEGEISDSESEAIENVYGSLVVMDKDKKPGQMKTAAEKSNQQRKIQICLVINSDKEGENKPTEIDFAESGAFENKSKDVISIDSDASVSPDKKNKPESKVSQAYDDAATMNDNDDSGKAIIKQTNGSNTSFLVSGENKKVSFDTTIKPTTESSKETSHSPSKNKSPNKSHITPTKILYSPSQSIGSPSPSPVKLQHKDITSDSTKNIANFYKPHPENVDAPSTVSAISSIDSSKSSIQSDNINNATPTAPANELNLNEKNTENFTEIPLLNEPTLPPKAKKDVLSEIDILQALKNEILSETIPIAAADADTPALHKPQITKVASASEASTLILNPNTTKVKNSSVMPKKRISIENYKKKSETVAKSLFVKKRSSSAFREEMKKQSLKLTEKECERFNFPARLSLDDDTDDISDDDLLDDDKPLSLDDIYRDLAPKSPDQDNFCDDFDEAPVLIPVEPVKTAAFASKTDVDLRSFSTPPRKAPLLPTPTGLANVVAPTLALGKSKASPVFEPNKKVHERSRKALVDPRLRRDSDKPTCKDSPTNFEGTPRPSQYPNIPPLLGLSMTPVYTPSYTPSMTPIRTPNARSYEMTPSHQLFEIEEPQQKHVYAPSFSLCDNQEFPINQDKPIWEPNRYSNVNDDHRSRRDAQNRWEYSRGSSAQRALQPNYNPRNDKFIVDRRDSFNKPDSPVGWTDCPGTPGNSFGRLEAPMTPNHSFGRSDCPTTPVHPFGRSDCPTTPIHPFGRSDCPPTPIHPFGRSDCPPTPSHPFGRSECPSTPNHPFGRSDVKDPRLNRRQSDYESTRHDERDLGYHNDRSYNRSNSYNRPYRESNSPHNYDREQHGTNDKYAYEQGSRALLKNDSSRLFTKSRERGYGSRYIDNKEGIDSRRNQRERSVGKALPDDPSRVRATSVGRSGYDNSLSVEPQAGCSFTIDTSVNATFQNLLESGKGIQVFDYTFDSRRQRASSVGRSLGRESSVGRILSHEGKSKTAQSNDTTNFQRRSNFRRAGSVGRVLVSDKQEKSFQEIKADFESYRLDSTKKNTEIVSIKDDISSKKPIDVISKENNSCVKKATSESNSRNRKEDFEKHSRSFNHNAKQPYSPRKNNRDPRMRIDQKDTKNDRNDRGSSYSWDRRRSGISYSNDNIAKGTIMGTGFGVKNYKIPKIKRPEPEQQKTPIEEVIKESEKIRTSSPKTDTSKKNKVSDKKHRNKASDDEVSEKISTPILKTHSGKTILVEKPNEKKDKVNSDDGLVSKHKLKNSKIAVISDDDSEKRVTRSSKKSDSNLKEEPNKKTKRIRKAIIDDSDSDAEIELNTTNENTKFKSKPTIDKESETLTKQKMSKGSIKTKRMNEFEEPTKSTADKEISEPQRVNTESEISTAEKELRKTLEEDSLDSSFGIDDMGIFSDNIVTDPVINNINDLIADLDKDLGTAKSGNDSFTTEMEKIIGSIDNQEENTLGDISELIEKDLNERNEKLKNVTQKDDNKVLNNEVELVTGHQNTATPIVAVVLSQKQEQNNVELITKKPTSNEKSTDPKVILDKKCETKHTNNSVLASNDEIVSTTHIDQSNLEEDVTDIKTVLKIDNSEQSAPDSTIVQNDEKQHESLPDSTMEIHSEVSSDVTSTLNDAEKSSKETTELSAKKEVSAIESFGNLLSILQDKSKIKELLSMLGEQSGESEKIKKKLEKLSQIVSDEEEEIVDQSKNCNTKKSFDSQSGETTVQTTNTLKEVKELINEANKHSAGNEVDITVKKSDMEISNKDELAEDRQLDDKNDKAECPQDPILEQAKVASNNGEPVDNKILDGQNKNDLNDYLESNENQDKECNEQIEKASPKKTKVTRRGRGRSKRGRVIPKRIKKSSELKTPELKPKIKKKTKSRELQTLQNDIKEMFMRDDVLNATGIRMCRLAKMVDKKTENDSPPKDNEPVVVLQKYKSTDSLEEPVIKMRKKPGPKPKSKIVNDTIILKKDTSLDTEDKIDKPKSATGYKPGPKSKTKQKHETMDPYEFESDSVADTNTTKESDANSSDSDNESMVSSESFGSSEVLADIKKKPKKKRSSWQTGVIKPKYKKKNKQDHSNKSLEVTNRLMSLKPVTIPDLNCFTDKMYCFQRGVFAYDCRLCPYSGTEIVNHYKKQHAHTEVPLSRMDPDTAKKAIQQCEEINFQAISKIPSEKYTCRFCYKEFSKNRVALETFFWHVVSTHTGEYKHLCYECVNVTRCPFNLDIPPPPKEVKGQLIGYICGKCNFTQISLENLKTHVIVRHNDEQTEVYTINLGVMTPKAMKAMLRKSLTEEQKPRTLRSSRSNQSTVEASDDRSEITGSDRLSELGSAVLKTEEPHPHIDAALAEIKRSIKPGPIKSKLRFETDDQERSDETSVKIEKEQETDDVNQTSHLDDTYNESAPLDETRNESSELDQTGETMLLDETINESLDHTFNTTAESDHTHNADRSHIRGNDQKINTSVLPKPRGTTDVFEKPHFKVNFKESGAKEYVCCVNGEENHYKTTLLISLKKHVQTKHSENWDGYCCVCKVIVTLQGVQSSFKDCLTHFLDKHMDDFPVMEKAVENTNEDSRSSLRSSSDAIDIERTESPRTYIAVRPLSDLISKDVDADPPVCGDSESPFPVIENVVSLGDKTVEAPQASPVYPTTSTHETLSEFKKPFQYEEVQAEIMSKKHRIVLDTMMPKEMLVRVFKCAGRFCSFTSDSAEDSLVHASAHKQLGGEGALDCAYCNFNAAGNAIDLVMHVFKEHGRCQFSCVLCFYRAAADQLVGAHFSKAHGATGKTSKVLRSTSNVTPNAADSTNILSRETAVPHYICNHGEGSCKFRTYTPGKFHEHLQQKHGSADFHPCNLCEVLTPSPGELIKHMKTHGIKLYQCTWCVHGANSEAEMLSHAATLHPTKNPQAYLRIITNKDGSTELRVLPLIYLNKLKVPIEDVTPSKVKENPTREAERSIELEKLIRHTTLMLETESDNLASNPIPVTPELTETPAETIAESCDISDVQTVEAIENSLLSSPEKAPQNDVSTTSFVKDEPQEVPSLNQRTDHVVYCLDSDEEEAEAQNKVEEKAATLAVIDLSDDEQAGKSEQDTRVLRQLISEPVSSQPSKSDKPNFKKLPLELLLKCPNCEQHFRNVGGFKRHTNTCCLELNTIRCPHTPCPIVLTNITQLINHYNKDHNVLNITKHYYCGICKSRWSTLNVTKKHLKDKHNVSKVVITTKLEEDGTCTFTVEKEIRPVVGPLKRKTSVETPKKFGIEDIDKLPINPIMDSLVYCRICDFSTKVRLNMVRHLQLHAERQPVPQTAPVNPVPHLETNEKHFDKMVNLASSSAATRVEKLATVTPEAVSRYPKYVSDRQRHTCGAKDCSYISVDEGMLRIHWETLHSAAVDYHCAHCPPHQHLDTSKMLTASRIIAHLKMHDASLYACSSCSYYHYKKQIVEKHIADFHKDKGGQVLIVREEGTALQSPAAVGTMDLKPWQCGLCQFKSMLRRDVVEHCSKHHQTKMQYKCAYCPFRTSDVENIVKHQSNAHPAKAEDVFYYYYREGEVPNEADGTPRWQKQSQKCGIQNTEIKTEPDPTSVQPSSKTVPIDLNLVKKEVDDSLSDVEMSVEDLCKIYGQFCDPNGISYKCSLCKTVMEYTKDAMQSHLYEELKYRRWSCTICTYKAYHRAGLNEHMASEHSRNFIEPSELPVNVNIEKWVSKLLDHQSAIIERNKVNAQPKIATEKQIAGPSKVVEPPKPVLSTDTELVQAFGCLGSPKDDSYCCPKCKMLIKDEDEMRNHLESELTRIRWCCTKCTDKFPTFHEAQFHCKSHPGLLSRPKEAIRDPSLRSAWLTAVITTQKKYMKPNSTQHVLENIDQDSENSLLVVRYEEAAPTDEQLREIAREDQLREARKRSVELDSDDEDGMVICEPDSKKINDRNCPFCDFVSRSSNQYKLCMREHILRHYNLKILTCNYCDFNGHRKPMYIHLQAEHPGLPHLWKQTDIPNCLPSEYNLKSNKKIDKKIEKRTDDEKKKVCLHCEASVSEHDLITHLHGHKPAEFGEKADVVVKCCICLTLRLTLQSMQEHYKEAHPDITNLNYAFYKLQIDTREVHACGICTRRFTFLRDLRIHHSAMHGTFNLTFKTVPYRPEEDDHDTRGKRKLEDVNPPVAKRIAKKSTSKLPHCKTVAKKSTTKLPSVNSNSDSEDEFSFYGTKPSVDEYENVKTMMPMYNTMVEIDVKKLSGILKIDPKVVVKDFRQSFTDT